MTTALILSLFVALPLAWPLGELSPGGLSVSPHVWALARNTAALVAWTLTLALPVGTLLAVLLERTDLPGRRGIRWLLALSLFVPLPLLVSGWQALLPTGVNAAGLHTLAALPWVILILGAGLRAVERDLEDDARLIRPPAWVILHVTLRRALTSVVAAALWVTAQVTCEVTITDLMQVRTFAEEVYSQLVAPESEEPVSRAVTAALLGVAAMVGTVLLLARHVDRLVPSSDVGYRDTLVLHLGTWRWLVAVVLACAVLMVFAGPWAALAYRSGLTPDGWSISSLFARLRRAVHSDAGLIARTSLVCTASGLLAATAALVSCWLARGSRWFRVALLILLGTAWAMPGPVVGLGLMGLINSILNLTDSVGRLPRVLLWDGPSVVPLLLVNFVRFLPFAAAIVWPAVHRLPGELFDLARLDGVSPSSELARIVWPLTWGAWRRATLAVAILSLGEVSAGKLVSTPNAEGFAESVWTQLHYGVTADLAARCFVMFGVVLFGACYLAIRWERSARGR